jgi:hypothetical protein
MTLSDGRSPDEPTSVVESELNAPAWARLTDQLAWYDHKSVIAQRWYKTLRVSQLVLSVSIPVVVGFGAPSTVAAVLGALIAIVEGIQQLFQFHERWIGYRSTAEALKRNKYLYLSGARPYAGHDRDRQLAERVEALVSREHTQWTITQPKETPEPSES